MPPDIEPEKVEKTTTVQSVQSGPTSRAGVGLALQTDGQSSQAFEQLLHFVCKIKVTFIVNIYLYHHQQPLTWSYYSPA